MPRSAFPPLPRLGHSASQRFQNAIRNHIHAVCDAWGCRTVRPAPSAEFTSSSQVTRCRRGAINIAPTLCYRSVAPSQAQTLSRQGAAAGRQTAALIAEISCIAPPLHCANARLMRFSTTWTACCSGTHAASMFWGCLVCCGALLAHEPSAWQATAHGGRASTSTAWPLTAAMHAPAGMALSNALSVFRRIEAQERCDGSLHVAY